MILPYRAALGVLRAVAPVLSAGKSKLARGMAGRRRAHELLEGWGRSLRDGARPVLWFHAPSVGEGHQAKAVIEACLERRPETQIVFTFFSPSAEALARDMGADVATYLPWDLRAPMRRVLDAVRPDGIVFTRTEVWPVLAAEARRRGVPMAMVGATLARSSSRRRWPTRVLLRSAWASLDRVAAVAEGDGARLIELGVALGALSVPGDPAVDSAVSRLAGADADAPWLRPFRRDSRPNLVAGSTWPADERALVPALAGMWPEGVDAHGRALRVVIAPHEPTPRAVASLVRTFSRAGLTVRTLSHVESSCVIPGSDGIGGVDVVIVDRVGVLSGLYGIGAFAFVGGGFHRAGLHSVLEPAAAGLPIVFGTEYEGSAAARELLVAGGAKLARDSSEVAQTLTRWLQDEAERRRVGRLASGYIESHRGAAARAADLICSLLPHPS